MDWLLFKHKETSRMTIDIDMENRAVLITQRWRIVDKGNNSSASIEHFKRMVVSTIQTIWNRRCFINLIEKNAIKKEDRKKSFRLDLRLDGLLLTNIGRYMCSRQGEVLSFGQNERYFLMYMM